MSIIKRRIKRLYDKMEKINNEFPDLVQEVITKNKQKYKGIFHDVIEKNLENEINSIIHSIATLSKRSKVNLTCELLDGFNNSKHDKIDLISTSKYGRKIGIDAKVYLFGYLLKFDLITKNNKFYELTKEGVKFGDYIVADNGEKYIGWNKGLLDEIFDPVVCDLNKLLDFEQLFHLTHITNLQSILDRGLKCHNDAPVGYKDISNPRVNNRRQREIKGFGNLHDYVPLYFNPRNAMLFQICKRFPDDIVVLEIKKEIIAANNTLFSQGNAARRDSCITYCRKKVASFDWEMIYSKIWIEIGSGIVSEEEKSMMMSECLIYRNIPSSHIERIHCKNISTADKVLELMKENIQEIKISPEIYF